MKTDISISEALDGLNEEELSKLLENIEIDKAPLASRRIAKRVKKGMRTANTRTVRFTKRAWLSLAVCAVLLIGLGVGTHAYAEEAREYKEAERFFADNGLSMEGLTRGDIKAVYRDITTESFTYDKTAEVVAHNLEINGVNGYTILSSGHTSFDVKEAWKKLSEVYLSQIHYFCDDAGVEHLNTESDMSTLGKYRGYDLIWHYTTNRMRLHWARETEDGVIAVGVVPCDFSVPYLTEYTPALLKLTKDGEFVWFASWDNGAPEEQILDIITAKDGSVTVFSQMRDRDKNEFALCVSKVDANGNYISSTVNVTGDCGLLDVTPFDGGFLAIQYDNTDFKSSVVRIDADGSISDKYIYSSEGKEYEAAQIKVFSDRVYISTLRKDTDKLSEINRLYSGDDITDTVRESFTSVLLVCEEGGKTPAVFYEVEGSLPDMLTLEDGKLAWTYQQILSCERAYGGCSMTGTAELNKLLIDANGNAAAGEIPEGVPKILFWSR